MTGHLLHVPHHDGSALHVSDAAPAPGDVVTVRVRVPHDPTGAPGATTVAVRVPRDGEPVWAAA